MKEITIDCRGFASRSDLHKAFAEELSFPEWYGNNLDALHDQLTSIGEGTVIHLQNWSEAEASMGRYALCAVRAVADAQQKNPNIRLLFE